jgi:hypothetical protein
MAVRLSALRCGRPLPPGRFLIILECSFRGFQVLTRGTHVQTNMMKIISSCFVIFLVQNIILTYLYIYVLTYSRIWALLEEPLILQPLKNFPKFMKPEVSIPCSQEPSTGPYCEPHQSTPFHYLSNIPECHKSVVNKPRINQSYHICWLR